MIRMRIGVVGNIKRNKTPLFHTISIEVIDPKGNTLECVEYAKDDIEEI